MSYMSFCIVFTLMRYPASSLLTPKLVMMACLTCKISSSPMGLSLTSTWKMFLCSRSCERMERILSSLWLHTLMQHQMSLSSSRP